MRTSLVRPDQGSLAAFRLSSWPELVLVTSSVLPLGTIANWRGFGPGLHVAEQCGLAGQCLAHVDHGQAGAPPGWLSWSESATTIRLPWLMIISPSGNGPTGTRASSA